MRNVLLFLLCLFIGAGFAQMQYFTLSNDYSCVVKVENHALRVDLKQGYADVEEELVLRAASDASGVCSSWAQPTAIEPLEIRGDLVFPQNASVVGMLLWNGSTILKAKLKPTASATEEYESVVDREDAPPPAPRDPALLVRKSQDTYSLSVYPVTLGATRKVRLRYLVPISPTGDVSLEPVGWGNSDVQLDVKGSAYADAIVRKNGINTSLDIPFSWTAQAVDNIHISVKQSEKLGSLRTSFGSGEWKGYYWWFNGEVPQELLKQAGLKREVIFLWNWNQPEYFLTGDGSLSAYGQMAVSHADGLRYTIQDASSVSANLYFGLVHRQREGKILEFPLGNAGSKNLNQIQDYLGSITPEAMPNMVPSRPEPSIASSKELTEMKKKSQDAFDLLIQKSVTLFSAETGVIKHIVVVVSGPQLKFETPDLEDVESLTLPAGVTLSRAAGDYDAWLGVDLPKIEYQHGYAELMEPRYICSTELVWDSWSYQYTSVESCRQSTYPFPAERKLHFTAQVKVDGVSRYYDLVNTNDRLLLAFHSLAPIDSVAKWTAYNQLGYEVASMELKIPSVQMKQDSGIVKIVGANPDMKSDVYATEEVGAAFGVVRYDYALVALEADSVGSALNTSLKLSGLPYLTASEIFKPAPEPTTELEKAKDQLLNQIRIQRISRGKIRVELQGEFKQKVQRAEILDLHGRVVARLDCAELQSLGRIEWDGSHNGMGLYVLRVVAGSQILQKKFLLQ